MNSLRCSFICIICLAASLSAQPWQVNPIKLRGLGQDSTGQVWAVGYAPSQWLYRWEGDKWKPAPVEDLPGNPFPMAVASGSDGAVYCVWSVGMAHVVTWHRGTASKVMAQFTGSLEDSPSIFADARGNVWITERGPHIYRVTPQGWAGCVYTIPNDEYISISATSLSQRAFNPIYATSDALGRVWFWSGGMPGRNSLMSLQGLLIAEGDSIKYHPTVVGVSYEKVAALEPEDADHMLMAVAEDRLYRVDAKTLLPTVVVEPEMGAFRNVQRIFHLGQDTYIVSSNPGLPVSERSGEGRLNFLWRLRGGEWKRVVNGLDMRTVYAQDPTRPLVATPTGLWVGAYGTGPWFIPSGAGEPVHVDWHYDYPFEAGDAMFQLSDGRLLLVALNQGSIVVKSGELLAAFQSPSEIRTLNSLRPFTQDQRAHLWGILAAGDKALSEWDGKSWIPHALPYDFGNPTGIGLVADSQDQIWMLANPCRGPVAVLNPAHGNFDIYSALSDALQAQLPNHPTFHADQYSYIAPTFTPDGRIGYGDRCGQYYYFDGHIWQSWNRQQIDRSRMRSFPSPVFFDRAGNFAVNLEGTTWEYLPNGGWRSTTFEPGPGTGDMPRPRQPVPPPPPGCAFSNPESVAQDRLGMYWLTYRGQLYRAMFGLCLPQISPEEHQPFIDGRAVRNVLIDPQGNAFLETYLRRYGNAGEYVILDARQPLPQTKVQATANRAGNVKLRFDATVTGKVWFTWRVDDDVWSHPTQHRKATITGLADGKHRIEAAALDERLQIDPAPAVAEVQVHVDSQKQLTALIEQLNNPDFAAREAAVRALVRQPTLALPLLEAAREKAGPDQRWWIDAAIQQIKDSAGAKAKP